MSDKKIIEMIPGTDLIVCDNPKCDYTVPTEKDIIKGEDLEPYLNMPCPKCGENLLTEDDYKTATVLFSIVNAINSCSHLVPQEELEKQRESVHVKVHNGVSITK